eukprot:2799016-Rhodomonas_salina.5
MAVIRHARLRVQVRQPQARSKPVPRHDGGAYAWYPCLLARRAMPVADVVCGARRDGRTVHGEGLTGGPGSCEEHHHRPPWQVKKHKSCTFPLFSQRHATPSPVGILLLHPAFMH